MKKVEVKEEKRMEDAFSLWKNISKKGNIYYTGKDCNGTKLIAFDNVKTNEKQPDIEIYKNEEKLDKKICSLWINKTKDGKDVYLSGVTSENEKIVAFYSKKDTNNQPFIRAYFKDEE